MTLSVSFRNWRYIGAEDNTVNIVHIAGVVHFLIEFLCNLGRVKQFTAYKPWNQCIFKCFL